MIPPHMSHVLQPLDSILFAQFKKNWEKNLGRYNEAHSGRTLNKVDFWEVFSPSWNQAMTTKDIMAGFRNMGIYPYDPLAIPPSSMAPSEVTDYGEKSCFWCSLIYCLLKQLNFVLQIHFFQFLDYFHRNSLLMFL